MKLVAEDFLKDYRQVSGWISKKYSPQVVEDTLANFWLYPKIRPTTETALEIYQAKLRVEFSKTKLELSKTLLIPEKVVLASRNLSQALLIFLDGFQPVGIFDVEVDNFKLASCFCFEGKLKFSNLGKKVAEVEIDFGGDSKQKLQIVSDQIVKIPLSPKFPAGLRIKVFKNFKIAGEKKYQGEITGSHLGLIFDSRGRPIIPPGIESASFVRSNFELGINRVKAWKEALETGFQLKPH